MDWLVVFTRSVAARHSAVPSGAFCPGPYNRPLDVETRASARFSFGQTTFERDLIPHLRTLSSLGRYAEMLE